MVRRAACTLFSKPVSLIPSTQVTYVTYTVTSPPRLSTRTVSFALDAYTPIMLSNHIYWNLGAFKSPNILHDTLQLPYANRIVSIDSIAVPTGNLQSVKYPSKSPPVPLNFTAPKQIGDGALYSQQCGLGCVGIDNAFILDRPYGSGVESMEQPQLIWKSLDTGITMTVRTNQQSFQLYSCNGMDGTIPIKSSQGNAKIEQYGCLVIEPQQWVSGAVSLEFTSMSFFRERCG